MCLLGLEPAAARQSVSARPFVVQRSGSHQRLSASCGIAPQPPGDAFVFIKSDCGALTRAAAEASAAFNNTT